MISFKKMSCKNCEYGPLNSTSLEKLVCLKYRIEFPSMAKMNKWARGNCNEPDSSADTDNTDNGD